MRVAAKIGALIAAVISGAAHAIDLGGPDPRWNNQRRNKVSRGRGRYTKMLRRKFRRNAIERYGLAVVKRNGARGIVIRKEAVSADDRRRLRNARKQERRTAR